MNCLFCDIDIGEKPKDSYKCRRCGHVYLDDAAAEDIEDGHFDEKQKKIISIYIRNEYERQDRKDFSKRRLLVELEQIIKQYRPLFPLEKMDNALLNIEKTSKFIGEKITINYGKAYPYYHCFEGSELASILKLLHEEGLINAPDAANPHSELSISAKGYQRLSEIRKTGSDSRQCFVAMWLASEMDNVYENVIKPAIEYIEEGESEPRFRALRIDNSEHINDINDEIISEIRRSRFMVCDLTGYRGGVYFEAGFAYGLGLDIIYTCRKDWIKQEILKNETGEEIQHLVDSGGNRVEVKKEGVHFDIEHINRIEWEAGNLDEFKEKLEKRIKAVIT